jgi:hypothetical protein
MSGSAKNLRLRPQCLRMIAEIGLPKAAQFHPQAGRFNFDVFI